jgi:hypothetical protein
MYSVYFVNFGCFVIRKLSVAVVGAGEVIGFQVLRIREVAAAEVPTVESSLPLHSTLSQSLLASVVLRGWPVVVVISVQVVQAVFQNSALLSLPMVDLVEPLVIVGALVD